MMVARARMLETMAEATEQPQDLTALAAYCGLAALSN